MELRGVGEEGRRERERKQEKKLLGKPEEFELTS